MLKPRKKLFLEVRFLRFLNMIYDTIIYALTNDYNLAYRLVGFVCSEDISATILLHVRFAVKL